MNLSGPLGIESAFGLLCVAALAALQARAFRGAQRHQIQEICSHRGRPERCGEIVEGSETIAFIAASVVVMAAVIAGFGRVIAEVGVAMMLGGNIRGTTRTMTTAIALETSKGEFAFGLSLGIVLLSVALLVNLFLNFLQQR